MKNFINLREYLNPESSGNIVLNTLYITELKERYGHERIVFWHFRHFWEMCDYILENDIRNENFLSKDAKHNLINFISTFIKNHQQ